MGSLILRHEEQVRIRSGKLSSQFGRGCGVDCEFAWAEYNPSTEAVTRVVPKTKSQVVVQTDRKSDYMGGVREYVLKKQERAWLIDSGSATVGVKKMKLTLV